MNTIAIDKLSRQIGRTWAIRDVNLEIHQGEVFGIYGRTGSGKSTLSRLIAGMEYPTSGSVSLKTLDDKNDTWLNAQISIALQQPGLAPELTVFENLRLFASLWQLPRKGRTGRLSMFMELLGLADARNRRIRELPDGMRLAAEVARALVPRAEIYVIDGLIERLDRPVRRRFWEFVLSRKRHGETFIIATSSADEATLCDRLALISHGNIAAVGKPRELVTSVRKEVIVVESMQTPVLRSNLRERFGAALTERQGTMEFRSGDASRDVARILSETPSEVGCVYFQPPTLDDVLDRIEENQ